MCSVWDLKWKHRKRERSKESSKRERHEWGKAGYRDSLKKVPEKEVASWEPGARMGAWLPQAWPPHRGSPLPAQRPWEEAKLDSWKTVQLVSTLINKNQCNICALHPSYLHRRQTEENSISPALNIFSLEPTSFKTTVIWWVGRWSTWLCYT